MKKKGISPLFVLIYGLAIVAVFLVIILIPPKLAPPRNEYGEFPFKLVYQINDEIVTIEDTLVFKYLGTGWNEGVGAHYKWETSYLSGKGYPKENSTLIELYKDEENSVEIDFVLGDVEYYMEGGSSRVYGDYKVGDIIVYETKENDSILSGNGLISGDDPVSDAELYERFSIKIIEAHLSEPASLDANTD